MDNVQFRRKCYDLLIPEHHITIITVLLSPQQRGITLNSRARSLSMWQVMGSISVFCLWMG